MRLHRGRGGAAGARERFASLHALRAVERYERDDAGGLAENPILGLVSVLHSPFLMAGGGPPPPRPVPGHSLFFLFFLLVLLAPPARRPPQLSPSPVFFLITHITPPSFFF